MSHNLDAEIGSVLDEIEEIAGGDVVRALRLEFPGVRVYFGANPDPESTLVKAIGLDAARSLGAYFGGDHVMIPTGKAAATLKAGQDKARFIVDLSKQGLKVPQIALRAGVTERWVYQVLAKARKSQSSDKAQKSLFD